MPSAPGLALLVSKKGITILAHVSHAFEAVLRHLVHAGPVGKGTPQRPRAEKKLRLGLETDGTHREERGTDP